MTTTAGAGGRLGPATKAGKVPSPVVMVMRSPMVVSPVLRSSLLARRTALRPYGIRSGGARHEDDHRGGLLARGGAALPGPAGREFAERTPGRRDEEADRRQHVDDLAR